MGSVIIICLAIFYILLENSLHGFSGINLASEASFNEKIIYNSWDREIMNCKKQECSMRKRENEEGFQSGPIEKVEK